MPLFGEGGKGEGEGEGEVIQRKGEGEGEVIQRKGAMARSLRVEFRIWAVKVAIKQEATPAERNQFTTG